MVPSILLQMTKFHLIAKALHCVYVPHSPELSPVDGRLNSFRILALGSRAAANVSAQMPPADFISWNYAQRGVIRSYGIRWL